MYESFHNKLTQDTQHNTQNFDNDLTVDQAVTTYAFGDSDSFYNDCIVEAQDQVGYFTSGAPKYAICDGGAVEAGVFDHDIRWHVTGILGNAESLDIDDFEASWVHDFTCTRDRLDTTHWTVEIADKVQRSQSTDERLSDVFRLFESDEYGHWQDGQFYFKHGEYIIQLTPWSSGNVELTTPSNGSTDPYSIGIDSDSWWDHITAGGEYDITDEVGTLAEYVETLEGDYETTDVLQAVAKCREVQENDGLMVKLVEAASETDLPTVEHTIIDLLLNHGEEVREVIEQLIYIVDNK